MADFYESRDWLELRYRVLQRASGSCKLCGCRGTAENPLQVDHIEPRSKRPELELVESNMQVLCKSCNMGKSNKDNTDWRWKASQELIAGVNRKAAILASANGLQLGKLQQLGWLRRNDIDPHIRSEAEKQFRALWAEVEAAWKGGE